LPPSPEIADDQEGLRRDDYDALDEALMETFPASDPIAVQDPADAASVREAARLSDS
jgi:hypothetical protein